jgi:hypothetical protein
MSELDEQRRGCFPGEDAYYLPSDTRVREILQQVESRGLPPAHQNAIKAAVGETLTHQTIENARAEARLREEVTNEDVSEDQRAALDRLREDDASVADRLAILASRVAPDVDSLELGRVYHFMNPDVLPEERVLTRMISDGIEESGFEGKTPALHKVHVHDIMHSPSLEGGVTGAIVSVKVTVAGSEDSGVLVRHRLKAYVPIEELTKRISPYDGYGGSVEEQELRMQRVLRKTRESSQAYLEPSSLIAGDILDTVLEHPENWLTSIYYGCRQREGKPEPKEPFPKTVQLGGLTLQTVSSAE